MCWETEDYLSNVTSLSVYAQFFFENIMTSDVLWKKVFKNYCY